jgi:uncharacterized protein with FMN-binding domain
MTILPNGLQPKSLEGVRRQTRARRALALAGMLAVVGGTVGLRAHLTPSPTPALSSSGLAAPVAGSSSPAPTSPKGSGRVPAHQVLVGRPYDVQYGIVQVKVTMSGRRITDVTAMSLPQGGRSSDISGFAAPQLRREVLKAQSAKIDTVSGASYTSAGYAESLQSALDRRR